MTNLVYAIVHPTQIATKCSLIPSQKTQNVLGETQISMMNQPSLNETL